MALVRPGLRTLTLCGCSIGGARVYCTYLINVNRILVSIIAGTGQAAAVVGESEDETSLPSRWQCGVESVRNATCLTGQPCPWRQCLVFSPRVKETKILLINEWYITMHNTLLQHNILLQFEYKNEKEITYKHVNIPCDILKIITGMEKKLVILIQHIYSGGDNVCCSKGLNGVNQYINYVQFLNHLQGSSFWNPIITRDKGKEEFYGANFSRFTLRMKMNITWRHW